MEVTGWRKLLAHSEGGVTRALPDVPAGKSSRGAPWQKLVTRPIRKARSFTSQADTTTALSCRNNCCGQGAASAWLAGRVDK